MVETHAESFTETCLTKSNLMGSRIGDFDVCLMSAALLHVNNLHFSLYSLSSIRMKIDFVLIKPPSRSEMTAVRDR